jgi:hypothetical protein
MEVSLHDLEFDIVVFLISIGVNFTMFTTAADAGTPQHWSTACICCICCICLLFLIPSLQIIIFCGGIGETGEKRGGSGKEGHWGRERGDSGEEGHWGTEGGKEWERRVLGQNEGE